MATLEMTAFVEGWEAELGWQTFVRQKDEEGSPVPNWMRRTPRHCTEFKEMAQRVVNDVRLSAITRVKDPESPWFAHYCAVVAPESIALIQEVLEDFPGIELLDDGTLRIALKAKYTGGTTRDEFKIVEALTGRDFDYDHDDAPFSLPRIEITLTEADVGCEVDYALAPNPLYEGEDDWRSPVVTPDFMTSWVYIHTKAKAKARIGYHRSDWTPPEGVSFWEAATEWHRFDGFNFSYNGRRDWEKARAFCRTGSPSKFARAAGTPSDAVVERIKNKGLENADRKRGRLLSALDYEEYPVGVWPTYASHRVRHMDGVGRRASEMASATVAVLGLNDSRDGFVTFSARKMNDHLPKLDTVKGTEARFWSAPVDRLVFQRSALGWHGTVMLNVRADVRDADLTTPTPEAWFAYCIPVFLAHGETKSPMHRYRRLPPEIVACIAHSHGLSDFLQHALFAIKGAQAKLGRKGLSLDNLPFDKPRTLPDGHLIRSWGLINQSHPYEVDRTWSGRGVSVTRACELMHDVLAPFGDKDALPIKNPFDLAKEDFMEAPVQPVATRRVLEV